VLCRKLLLSSRSAQQQHDAAVTALQAAGASPADLVAAIVGSSSAAGGAGSSKKQQSLLSGISRLWGADKASSSSRSAASNALPASPLHKSPEAAAGLNGSAGAGNNSERTSIGEGLDASDVVWAAQLDAAMACEVQLLSDMCVSSLRHIHKLTALSTLMEDFW
jgi:hypothetical protein